MMQHITCRNSKSFFHTGSRDVCSQQGGFNDHVADIKRLTLRWMNNDAECAVGFENDGQSRSIQPIAAATLLHGQGETIAFIRISAALAYTSTAVDMTSARTTP
jgi:hypothetical protein